MIHTSYRSRRTHPPSVENAAIQKSFHSPAHTAPRARTNAGISQHAKNLMDLEQIKSNLDLGVYTNFEAILSDIKRAFDKVLQHRAATQVCGGRRCWYCPHVQI